MCASSFRPSSSATSPNSTRAPSAANFAAMAAPRLRAPPLISATLPANRPMLNLLDSLATTSASQPASFAALEHQHPIRRIRQAFRKICIQQDRFADAVVLPHRSGELASGDAARIDELALNGILRSGLRTATHF